MRHQNLTVPSAQEFLEEFGEEPREESDDPSGTVQYIRIEDGRGDTIRLSYDVVGCSVRYQWIHGATVLVDCFREGAEILAIRSIEDTTCLIISFDLEILVGKLILQVYPEIQIQDKLLVR